MGILVITWNYPPRRGGMENLIAGLCDGLRENHRVEVITAYADGCKNEGSAVHRPSRPGLWAFFLYSLRQGAALLRGDPSLRVIFGGSVLVTPIVLLLARWFHRRAAVQAHGLDLIYPNQIYQWLIVRWLRRVDRVIANSNHSASLALGKGVLKSALAVIPPGVDWQRFQVTESADGLKQARSLDGKKIILFVGRLARRKGLKEFIEQALVQIIKEVPEACLIIVGDNPTESLAHRDDGAAEIRRTIAALNLSDQVCWRGAVADDELAETFALCDLLVLPVLALPDDVEGFGIVALEAAAAGKPVVATAVGGIPDAVAHGQSGLLVAPGDYRELSRAIIGLLNDDAKRQRMGKFASQRAATEFSWATIVARYEEIFGA